MSWLSEALNGSGTSKTTKGTTVNEPWAPVQGPMKELFSGATDAFHSGLGSMPYTGATFAPFTQPQQTGMANQMAGAAYSQPYMNASMDVLGQQAGNASGMTPYQQNALNAQMGVMNNPLSPQQQAVMANQMNLMNAGGLTPEMRQMMATQQGIVGSGGYNDATRNAMGINQGVVNQGGYNAGMTNAAGVNQNVINQGGMTPQMRSEMQRLQTLADQGGLTGDQRTALDRMKQISGGSMLNANPYLDKMIGKNADDITRAQNMAASGAGRYGSGGFQGATQEQIGRMALNARGENYARERSAQDAATQNLFQGGQTAFGNMANTGQQLFGMGNTGMGNVMTAGNNIGTLGQNAMGNMMSAGNNIGTLGQNALTNMATASQQAFGMGNTGLSNMTNAGGNAAGIGQQGLTNMTGAANNIYGMGTTAQGQNIENAAALGIGYNNLMSPGASMREIGGQYQNLAQQQLDNERRIYNEKQMQPWNQLGLLGNVLSGASPYGAQATTSTAPGASPMQGIMGGAAFGYQMSPTPYGALIGGAAGYLGR